MTPNRSLASALLVIALVPSDLFACSPDPGVDPDAFYRMIALPGRVASAVSVLAAIAWLIVARRPTTRRSVLLIALAVLNPGWWLWASGDCGKMAFWIGGALALLSVMSLGTGLWSRRSTGEAAITPPGV